MSGCPKNFIINVCFKLLRFQRALTSEQVALKLNFDFFLKLLKSRGYLVQSSLSRGEGARHAQSRAFLRASGGRLSNLKATIIIVAFRFEITD
jgi:hypothetical protein